MEVVVVNCTGSNILSIESACWRSGIRPQVTTDATVIQRASKIILPGVASAVSAMRGLEKHGLIDIIRNTTQPVLGICLGLQLFFETSEEGDISCLQILPGRVRRLSNHKKQVPHMGWNTLTKVNSHSPLLKGVKKGDFFYYAHSYYVPMSFSIAETCYVDVTFNACLQHKNFFGCQFHPERSSHLGERVIKNFLDL